MKPQEKLFATLRKMTLTPDTVTDDELCDQYKYIGGNNESGQKFLKELNSEIYREPVLPKLCPCGKTGIMHWKYIWHPENQISIAVGKDCFKKFLNGINRVCHNDGCENETSSSSPYCKWCLKGESEDTIMAKSQKLVAKGLVDPETIRNELGLTKYEQYIFDSHVDLFLSRIKSQIRAKEYEEQKRIVEERRRLKEYKLLEEKRIKEAENKRKEKIEQELVIKQLAEDEKKRLEQKRLKEELLIKQLAEDEKKRLEQKRLDEERLRILEIERQRELAERHKRLKKKRLERPKIFGLFA
jgi:hypothetical protein